MRVLLCAFLMGSAPSFCLGQDESSKPEGIPGSRLRRPPAAEFWAAAPVRWEFPTPPPPEVTFPSTGPLDLLFGAPDALVGGAMHALARLTHDEGYFDAREEAQRSMAVRLMGAIDVGAIDRPFERFMNLLYDRESKYFSRWGESTLSTLVVDEGDEDLDSERFLSEQRKVVVKALARRYLGSYGDSLSDNLRREAFDVTRWGSTDFVIGPVLAAGYLYARGWEGRVRFLDVDCRLHLLPVQRVEKHLGRTNDILVSAASLEFVVRGCPFRAIVSGGVVDGRPALDFVGLGTSIGMVRKAIKLEVDPLETDR